MVGIGAQGQGRCPAVGHGGQSTSAPSAAGQDEPGGDGEGGGAPGCPTPPAPGGPSPGTPTPTPFPWLCPPGTTSHRPGATCQGHSTCAGGISGGPGPPAPPEGQGLCGEGAGGHLVRLLIPVGSRIWHPHHTGELPAPTSGAGKGNAPPPSLLGLSRVLGAPLGLTV